MWLVESEVTTPEIVTTRLETVEVGAHVDEVAALPLDSHNGRTLSFQRCVQTTSVVRIGFLVQSLEARARSRCREGTSPCR